jgi:hypothetical protein
VGGETAEALNIVQVRKTGPVQQATTGGGERRGVQRWQGAGAGVEGGGPGSKVGRKKSYAQENNEKSKNMRIITKGRNNGGVGNR